MILNFVSVVPNAQAEGRWFGSWIVGAMENTQGIYAATVNDSEGVLGQYCYGSNAACYWLLDVDLECESEARFPALINSDSGSTTVEVVCFKLGSVSKLTFTDFDAIDGIVKKSSRIGIVFSLNDGLFKVSRFTLNGAADSIAFMRDIAAKSLIKSTGTRDQTF